MKVLVCGDRNWSDRDLIRDTILGLSTRPDTIIEGECRGADILAREVAKELGIDFIPCPANWEKYGKAAGVLRNISMLQHNPDLVIGFHDNIDASRGTAHMLCAAVKAGIRTMLITHKNTIEKIKERGYNV